MASGQPWSPKATRRALLEPAASHGTRPRLPRWELRVRGRSGEVRRGRVVQESDHRAVDVNPIRTVRGWVPGGRVHTGQQVWPRGRQIEDNVLVDLAKVQACRHSLVGPQTELRVPEWAVCLRVTRISQCREVAEDVQQVATVAEGIDERGVACAGVLRRVTVLDQVLEALCLRVGGAGLTVDESEEALAGGAKKVVATVVWRLVERGHVG